MEPPPETVLVNMTCSTAIFKEYCYFCNAIIVSCSGDWYFLVDVKIKIQCIVVICNGTRCSRP